MKKIICITGATAGFGEATAVRFASNGWKVIITGRRQERLEKLASQLNSKEKDSCLALQFDVRNNNAVIKAFTNLPQEWKNIDVLVNNAGLALGLEPSHKANLTDWETMIDTNIKGLLYVTKALLPAMVERKKGYIINLGSIAGSYAYPGGNVYCGTKAFVNHFSQCLRSDVLGTNIRVSCIEPGLAESEFSLVRFKGDAGKADTMYSDCKALVPEDIAETIFWLANCPEHMNVTSLEIMPTCQAHASLTVYRDKK